MNPVSQAKAYSYIRFSTPEQVKGDSLRRQTELSALYALEHNLDLDDTLKFYDPGVSAFNKSNLSNGGQLRAFLDAIDQRVVLPGSFLLVESLDRISRAEILDALEIFTGILNRGITIVTLADNMAYSKDKANRNFTDLIISITIMSRAHEESLTKSKRLKAAWDTKRKNLNERKLTRRCPSWMKLNESRSAYELIPEKIAIIRQIIDQMMSGMGKGSIAKKFNQQGIHSIGIQNENQTWYPSYITNIVSSRALIGEFQPMHVVKGKRVPAGDPISNYFPSAITDEEFAILQQLIKERGQKSGGNRGKYFSNLFTGFVKCGYCGSTMTFINKGKGAKSHTRFLVCSKSKRGAGCYYLPWTYDEFEEAFILLAKGIDFEHFIKESADQTKTVRSIGDKIVVKQADRDKLAKRRENLIEAISNAAMQPKSMVEKIIEYETSIDSLDNEIASLKGELASANNLESISKNTHEIINELVERLSVKSGEDLLLLRARINEYLRRVIRELVLFPGGTIHTAAEVAQIMHEIKASGRYSEIDIENYAVEFLPTQPKKQDRYFVIKNKDRVLQMLKPDHVIPDLSDALMNNPEWVKEWFKRNRSKIDNASQ